MKLPKVHSLTAFSMLSDQRVKDKIEQHHKINRSYDVPYCAGYSVDGKTVYIDRHLPTVYQGTDITRFLVTHEITEKALIDVFNLNYQQAHHIATHVEHNAVVEAGLDWEKYQHHFQKYIKKLGHEKLTNSPDDLDLTPYVDEADFSKFVAKRRNK